MKKNRSKNRTKGCEIVEVIIIASFIFLLIFLMKPAKKNKKDKSGYVYFIESNGLIKIGRTKNLEQRMKQFRTTLPYMKILKTEKTKDMHALEKYYHDKFKKYRGKGEWFDIKIKNIVNKL